MKYSLKNLFRLWLYRMWQKLGCPFPRLARHLRYRTFQWLWLVNPELQETSMYMEKLDIAVIITCHNYGIYLQQAVDSVLAQSIRPREIIIVDDASTDDTPDIAAMYQDQGVRYLRGEWRSVESARNAGAQNTQSPLIVFLDADDILPQTYLERCRNEMRDPSVGIVYGDMWEFGERHRYLRAPQYNLLTLLRENFISSHAMIKRQAYEVVGGYRVLHNAHEDWDLYKRILQFHWIAKKTKTYVRYRIHTSSMLQKYIATNPPYAHRAAFSQSRITIFTPFAGRADILNRFTDSLLALDVDPNLVHLHWFNTATDPTFETMLQHAMNRLPFAQMTYSRAPLPDIFHHSPDSLIKNRVSNQRDAQYFYEMAVVYAYNSMLRSCDTELILTLEDDVLLSPSTLRQMTDVMRPQTVAVVAHYPCHLQGYSMVWDVLPDGTHRHEPKRRKGVEQVGGSGFGCSLFRFHELNRQPIRTAVRQSPPLWYDHIAFDALREHGEVLCNWDIDVEHVKTERYL